MLIASSARPATPIVRDAVPLLRWSAAPEPGGPFGWRSTRSPGIRIWLDRPWFSSGDGELLGVLVFDRSEYVKRDGAWVTEARTPPPDGATSLWAADPILHAPARVGDPTVPPLLGTEHLILDALTAGFAGAVGYGLDATVINIPVAIEYHLIDILLLGHPGNFLAHHFGAALVAVQAGFGLGKRKGRGGSQSYAIQIVDDLGVDVQVGPEHNQTRTLEGAVDFLADTDLAALPGFVLAVFHDAPPYFLPPDLPTLRRIVSVTYLIPLPL